MKLIDLHAHARFLPNLYEIFNTKIPVDNWKRERDNMIGTIFIDNEEYKIIFEPGTFPLNQKQYSFINIAFAKMMNGQPVQELTFTNKRGSAVIGAIVHAMYDKLPEFNADAIIFMARDNVEQRMRIYNYLATHANGEYSGAHHKPNIPLGDGAVATVLFRNYLPKEDVAAFINYVENIEK